MSKVINVVFSPRKNGNCADAATYNKNILNKKGYQVETIYLYDYDINPCGNCDYHCFKEGNCNIDDDVYSIYQKLMGADYIMYYIPTFAGHLSSMYFMFHEREQGIFSDNDHEYNHAYMKKIHIIVIGNSIAGGDLALTEALSSFKNMYQPETLLLSSRDYNASSIKGNLINNDDVKHRLNLFVNRVIKV
ncbi:flavodoxin family protein [Haloplasma contractile]|uniref:NADPH-dependent FMN reductase protein n=1 Tax=Haloplasma contractile SSD-17B TaxID=1033810 RepID=U2E9K4_9MOLU|nr:NAD(P)H-dependent oxidoreductase [Haloplasma contractile]ERJ11511.1 NADPH-dependent FMN reductase protein [Haloplasma contractile SSD-17B]